MEVDVRRAAPRSTATCSSAPKASRRRPVTLLLPGVEPAYSGYVGWRGTVDAEHLSAPARAAAPRHHHLCRPALQPGPDLPDPRRVTGRAGPRSLLNWLWYRNVEQGAGARRAHDRPVRPGPPPLARPGHGAGRGGGRAAGVGQGDAPAAAGRGHRDHRRPLRPGDRRRRGAADGLRPGVRDRRRRLRGPAPRRRRHGQGSRGRVGAGGGARRRPATTCRPGCGAWEPAQLALGRFVVGRSRDMGERSQVSCTWDPEDRTLRFGLRGAGR